MKEANKDTIRVSTLPAKYQKKLADRYGEVHPQDFLSGDKKTYFKFDGENKATGSVTHRPINMPSFESMYLIYSKLVGSVKYLAKNQEIADDKDARQLFDTIKTTYRQLQTYLRNERPEQYELMKMRRVMEENTYKEIIEVLAEEKPGLWANIRAKKARGEKPAHKNSNAHKDAVKAGKKINKSEGIAGDTRAEAIKLKADLKQLKVHHVSAMKKVVNKRGWEDPGAVYYRVDFTLKGHEERSTKEEHIETLKKLNIPEGWSIFWYGDRMYFFKGADGPTPLQWITVKDLSMDAEKIKEGLWANINAKKKAGKKSSHGNSNAHKDAVKAGNAMKKEGFFANLKAEKRKEQVKREISNNWQDNVGGQQSAGLYKSAKQMLAKYEKSNDEIGIKVAKGYMSHFGHTQESKDEKDREHQGSNYKWPMSKATKDRKEADKKANKK